METEIKVTDCGRDALQSVLSDHVNDGYEIVSVMFVENYTNAKTGIAWTMFTVVFKR